MRQVTHTTNVKQLVTLFYFYLRLLRSRSSVSKSRRGCGVSLGPCDCSTEELDEITVVWPEGWIVLNWNCGPIHRRRWGPVWVTISTCGKRGNAKHNTAIYCMVPPAPNTPRILLLPSKESGLCHRFREMLNEGKFTTPLLEKGSSSQSRELPAEPRKLMNHQPEDSAAQCLNCLKTQCILAITSPEGSLIQLPLRSNSKKLHL